MPTIVRSATSVQTDFDTKPDVRVFEKTPSASVLNTDGRVAFFMEAKNLK